MFDFNTISNLHDYLALFVSKTLLVVWYFIIDLILSKVCSHIHLCLLPNYLLQTLQIYLNFMWSFPLSKSKLLYSVLLMKHLLSDLS